MTARLTNYRSSAGLCLPALVVLFLFASCSEKAPVAKKPAMTAPVYVGDISVVDLKSKFVLIALSGTATAPEAGTYLTSISAAGESRRLKVTPERKRPFVTADIVGGEPKRGERVYR